VSAKLVERDESADAETWLIHTSPTPRQSWSALAVAAIPLLGFGAIAPFTDTPLLPAVEGFLPAVEATIFLAYVVTAVILFSYSSIYHSGALLALASGYLYAGLIIIPHAISFPGVLSRVGLFGFGLQSTAWLYIFWHTGFALAILIYAFLKDKRTKKSASQGLMLAPIGYSVAIVLVLVCGLAWLATAKAEALPWFFSDQEASPLLYDLDKFSILIFVIAAGLLWTDRRSVLDLWLIVVVVASILELAFTGFLNAGRFTLGYYARSTFALVASTLILVLLLAEIARLQARLFRSNSMLRQERNNKLMNLHAMAVAIRHEVNQPLAGITLLGVATLKFLQEAPPKIASAEAAVNQMIASCRNASEIFDNIRELFGKVEPVQDRVDVNAAALEVLHALEFDFSRHGIATHVELTPELPPVMAHKGQLQEVITNLAHNAIEAMAQVDDGARILKVKTERNGRGTIALSVEDTGPGLGADESSDLFEAFFTTKPHGMGLGLAICRMMVERHGGQILTSPAEPHGAIFRIVLLQAASPP